MNKLGLKKYETLLLLVAVSYNFFVYNVSRLIAGGWYHYDFTTSLDEKIPFVPWMIVIYFGCYIFWIVNYIFAVRYDRADAKRFFMAHMIGETVCFLAFVFLPTTMARPELTGDSFWHAVCGFLYNIDASDNLLPSIHCFVSWLCYIGVRKNKKIPAWYRIFSLVFALAVCVSTVTLKQHVLIDVFAGVALSEVSYLLAKPVSGLLKG